uniref:Uncharacterized protein n=1 Tax=virus sp. ctxAI8 TaxID=2825829 RepID=A0A8S5RM01_9VIRU|nr:MAG TPA: hypothetical protein [virus sp. ctxAI8]
MRIFITFSKQISSFLIQKLINFSFSLTSLSLISIT